MTIEERTAARADIEATGDLLERALKLAGLQLKALRKEISRA